MMATEQDTKIVGQRVKVTKQSFLTNRVLFEGEGRIVDYGCTGAGSFYVVVQCDDGRIRFLNPNSELRVIDEGDDLGDD